jgi:hypothetical protein
VHQSLPRQSTDCVLCVAPMQQLERTMNVAHALIKKILVATATPCRCFVQVAVHLCKDARGGAERSGELRLLELPRSVSGRSQQQARRLHWPGQRHILPAARSGVRPLCDLAHRALCVVSRVLFPLSSRTGACSHKKKELQSICCCVCLCQGAEMQPLLSTHGVLVLASSHLLAWCSVRFTSHSRPSLLLTSS